jgi:hypothetical protein
MLYHVSWHLLVYSRFLITFHRNLLPPSSGYKYFCLQDGEKQAVCSPKIGDHLRDYTVSYPRKPYTKSSPWNFQIPALLSFSIYFSYTFRLFSRWRLYDEKYSYNVRKLRTCTCHCVRVGQYGTGPRVIKLTNCVLTATDNSRLSSCSGRVSQTGSTALQDEAERNKDGQEAAVGLRKVIYEI